jgi:hypothetical protein
MSRKISETAPNNREIVELNLIWFAKLEILISINIDGAWFYLGL